MKLSSTAQEMVEFWETPRNIPFKGELISNDNGSVKMCAQAQILFLKGGFSVEQILNLNQKTADIEAAKLLGISYTHSIMLRLVNDDYDGAPQDVLTNPEKYLGINCDSILDFWLKLDSLSQEQFKTLTTRINDLKSENYSKAFDAAINAANTAFHGSDLIFEIAYCATWRWPILENVISASMYELIGNIEAPFFLPLFDEL